ncbi:MAG: type II restriction endonuclease [Anaerolineae bacterium]
MAARGLRPRPPSSATPSALIWPNLFISLCQLRNSYPDLTFIDRATSAKFAVDVKSTYRTSSTEVNGMTLGAFTGYFRRRDSSKNTTYPYSQYSGHFVLGVIYSKSLETGDERKQFTLEDLPRIPSVIRDFEFFAQPKYRIAGARPGSGNTRNIGSVTKIEQLTKGTGPFSVLGEEVYDDYWMYYLTGDMARAAEVERPYADLKTYFEYKQRGSEKLREYQDRLEKLPEDTSDKQGADDQ